MPTTTPAATSSLSRRSWLARLLLVTAAAPVAGVIQAETARADKKTKNKKQIAARAAIYKTWCEQGGGTATVTTRPGGTTVACTGSESGDWSCTVTSKRDRCFGTGAPPSSAPVTDPATSPTHGNEQPSDPTQPGGGAGVTPGAGNEQSGDGGQQAGGGAGVDPGGGAEQPGAGGGASDGGGVVLTSYHGGKHTHATHHGRHGRGHRR